MGSRRIAMVSLHTSPLAHPGSGDAGGMNVYVDNVSRILARRGFAVDVFTRATEGAADLSGWSAGAASGRPGIVDVAPGYRVVHLESGSPTPLRKEDLPGHLCAYSADLVRLPLARGMDYDLVHSHYWLSGHVGWVAARHWDVPFVHSMHTLGRVKNTGLAPHDTPEPLVRLDGEDQVVRAADRLVCNSGHEVRELLEHHSAEEGRLDVVPPGVDLSRFSPGNRTAARERLGVPADALLALFVGRLQPLKRPDLVIEAVARLASARPDMRPRLLAVICGGASGAGGYSPTDLADLAVRLHVADLVRFVSPTEHSDLADWYRSADVTLVPSHSESFGLVAVESQACATPVIAAAVGGLPTAVESGVGGLLVEGHGAREWADVLGCVLDQPRLRRRLARGARRNARRFTWEATVDGLLESYDRAMWRRGSLEAVEVGA